MKLSAYLDEKRVKPSDFAAVVGVTTEAIRLYVKGERIPRAATMQAIVSATDGLVTANDFFPAEAAE